MFVLADDLRLNVFKLDASLVEQKCVPLGCGCQLLQDTLPHLKQRQFDIDLVFSVSICMKHVHIEKETEALQHSCED